MDLSLDCHRTGAGCEDRLSKSMASTRILLCLNTVRRCRMPLEPGVITHIAAMASRFGQKQCNTKQPKQTTQTTNTASEHPIPPTHPSSTCSGFFFIFFLQWLYNLQRQKLDSVDKCFPGPASESWQSDSTATSAAATDLSLSVAATGPYWPKGARKKKKKKKTDLSLSVPSFTYHRNSFHFRS